MATSDSGKPFFNPRFGRVGSLARFAHDTVENDRRNLPETREHLPDLLPMLPETPNGPENTLTGLPDKRIWLPEALGIRAHLWFVLSQERSNLPA